MKRASVLCALLWTALCVGTASATAAGRFEPPDGKTLLIVGQEAGEIGRYWKQVGPAAGYMLYANLDTLSALREPWQGHLCADSGLHSLQDWDKNYPGTIAQIGLYMVGILDDINRGELDDYIEEMGEILRKTRKPVLLRVGYELDAGWNRYAPEQYVKAYTRVARILRGQSADGKRAPIKPVDNVALVWHSAAYLTYGERPFTDWWPGDEYVDWVGISLFAWKNESDNKANLAQAEKIAAFAKAHGKPLMIAESAPKQYYPATSDKAWDGWYAPMFAWIAAHNVKAFSYINQDWNAQPMWSNVACGGGGDWGDTRVQAPGSRVLDRWQLTVTSERFINQGDALYKAIGFVPDR